MVHLCVCVCLCVHARMCMCMCACMFLVQILCSRMFVCTFFVHVCVHLSGRVDVHRATRV